MLHDRSRSQIGLRPPDGRSTFPLDDVEALVVHYSTGEELGRPDAEQWWRGIQNYHMDTRRWNDIGYGYGIHARQPSVLEGRGAGVWAAHSPGWNGRSISLCVLGDDDPGQDVLDEVRARIVRWRDDCFRLLGRTVPVLGHRETQRDGYTACPGDELQAWIDGGMPVEEDDMEKVPQPDWLPDATIDRLLNAKVLTSRPDREPYVVWRTYAFLARTLDATQAGPHDHDDRYVKRGTTIRLG